MWGLDQERWDQFTGVFCRILTKKLKNWYVGGLGHYYKGFPGEQNSWIHDNDKETSKGVNFRKPTSDSLLYIHIGLKCRALCSLRNIVLLF